VRTFAGRSLSDCPFRFQGQYEDAETGFYYNRFRYYDPSIGAYLSQDPIGLAGGFELYNYAFDPNTWIDEFGLLKRPYIRKSTRVAVEVKARKTGGRFTDPNTGRPIPGGKRRPDSVAQGEYHLGHKPGHENWRLLEEAEAKGMTQKEFNNYVNNPDFFQIEDPIENMSHQHEKPKDTASMSKGKHH
jgi:RHS repeat-associated protein